MRKNLKNFLRQDNPFSFKKKHMSLTMSASCPSAERQADPIYTCGESCLPFLHRVLETAEKAGVPTPRIFARCPRRDSRQIRCVPTCFFRKTPTPFWVLLLMKDRWLHYSFSPTLLHPSFPTGIFLYFFFDLIIIRFAPERPIIRQRPRDPAA